MLTIAITSPSTRPCFFSGSPPNASSLGTDQPIEMRLSEAAREQLGALSRFPPSESQLKSNSQLCEALQEFCPNILRIVKHKTLLDDQLSQILPFCTSLENLDLSEYSEITEKALKHLHRHERLHTINLTGIKNIKNLNPLIETPPPHLRAIHVFGTSINFVNLIEFLNQNQITALTPPKNPPKGFFVLFKSELIQEITLYMDQLDSSINCDDIGTFLINPKSALKRVFLVFQQHIPRDSVFKLLSSCQKTDLDITSFEGNWSVKPSHY